jgi:hypothetical protein
MVEDVSCMQSWTAWSPHTIAPSQADEEVI